MACFRRNSPTQKTCMYNMWWYLYNTQVLRHIVHYRSCMPQCNQMTAGRTDLKIPVFRYIILHSTCSVLFQQLQPLYTKYWSPGENLSEIIHYYIPNIPNKPVMWQSQRMYIISPIKFTLPGALPKNSGFLPNLDWKREMIRSYLEYRKQFQFDCSKTAGIYTFSAWKMDIF